MPTIGTTTRPAYVYDLETDTWIPVGTGPHTHTLAISDVTGLQAALDSGVSNSTYFAAGKNKIINGDFAINQRAFSSTVYSGATFNNYGIDRFSTNNNGDGTTTASLQTFTPGTAPVAGYEGKNFYRAVTAGFTNAASRSDVVQPIESVRTFANETIVISFWARAGSGSPKIGVELQQVFGTGGSPSAGVNTPVGAITIGTSWQRYSISVAVPSIAGKTIGTDNNNLVYIRFWFSAGSDNSTRASSIGIQNNTFDIWGVQAEAGSVATAFQTATGTLQGELAACQRYYWRATSAGNLYTIFGFGYADSTTTVLAGIPLPTFMRVFPTSADYANLAFQDGSPGVIFTFSGLSLNGGSGASSMNNHITFQLTGLSGLTANRPGRMLSNNSTSGYIGFSAEL